MFFFPNFLFHSHRSPKGQQISTVCAVRTRVESSQRGRWIKKELGCKSNRRHYQGEKKQNKMRGFRKKSSPSQLVNNCCFWIGAERPPALPSVSLVTKKQNFPVEKSRNEEKHELPC